MLDLLRRVWRGAWRPIYEPTTGWWYLLDLPYRLRDVFCALFLFLFGPPWIGYLLYEVLANSQKHVLAGVIVLGLMWLLLFATAFLAGGSAPPKPNARWTRTSRHGRRLLVNDAAGRRRRL